MGENSPLLSHEWIGEKMALTPLAKGAENVGQQSTQFDCISRQGMRPMAALAVATSESDPSR